MVLAGLAFALFSTTITARHVTVFQQPGVYGGWPANYGAWAWGNEILVGFGVAPFKLNTPDHHQYDLTKSREPRQARSLDSGETWTIENPSFGEPDATDLTEPMNFDDPNFALTLRAADSKTSHFWYSTDRGKSWRGPFRFPMLNRQAVMARTDYVVNGPRDAFIFLTVAKTNGREGRVICARTRDGGLTWQLVSEIGDETNGFRIMPSAVRISPTTLLLATRSAEGPTSSSIELFRSDDNALTWRYLGKPAPSAGVFSGNAPSMIRLRDGRVVLTYGFRSPPYGVRARVSPDEGRTWSDEIRLREDSAAWDNGYPRTMQRPDGKILTIYYFAEQPHRERTIAATIWELR
jgi:hypothetical protein